MAASGYSPISLYYSTTASATPTNTNLVNGELALNITDGKLFYKDNAGTVQTLATKAATSGSFSTTTISTSETLSYGTANGVAYLNGSKVVTTGSALSFDGTTQTITAAYGAESLRLQRSGVAGQYSSLRYGSAAGNYGFTFDSVDTSAADPSFMWRTSIDGSTLSERMRLTSTGLGIGTSSPADKLEVYSTITARAASGTSALRLRNTTSDYQWQTVAGTNAINLYDNAVGSSRLTVDSSGNLGLGVTPSAWGTQWRATQSGATGALASTGSGSIVPTAMVLGCYNDNTNWKYQYTSVGAARYEMTGANAGSTHAWYISAGGTAGNVITFTQAMTLTAAGRLGLGLTSPSTLFEAYGGAAGTSSELTVGNASTAARFGVDTSNEVTVATGQAVPIKFLTSNTERARIDSSGNLGLGVTPSYKFQVKGLSNNVSVAFSDGTANDTAYILKMTSGRLDHYATWLGSGINAYHSWWVTNSVGTQTQALTLDASGNLGLGTTSPTVNLHVYNASSAEIRIASANIGLQLYSSEGAGTSVIGTYTNHALVFRTNATERARITSGGDLLVGDTTAAAKLWVYKTAAGNVFGARATFATYDSTVGFFGADRNTTNNSFYYIDCYNYGSASYRFRVADSGNVTNTNNSYGAISDAKLKENIVDATPKLANLMQVKVRNYNLIGDTTKQLGVVAQELETIFPAMVDEVSDKDIDGNDLGTTTKQVKYSVFVPMLIKAIQELKAEFDAYKATHP